MRIVFRVDASSTMGSGHVMRCLVLASALREQGKQTDFVCRAHNGHLCDLIEQRGFKVTRLPSPLLDISPHGIKEPAHAAWLGASWQVDAAQTHEAIAGETKPAWLVVDHYAIDSRWESALRTATDRILVIDDLADRVHDADLLLDQNLIADLARRYDGKIPPHCTSLLGPQYALLQPIFSDLREVSSVRSGSIKRILIFFGGADAMNMTGRSLAAFIKQGRPDIQVDVVINAASPHATTIGEQIAGLDNIHLHTNLPSLASLIATADLGIGACGVSSWERLCLGLPSIVVTLADNQRPIAAALQREGLIDWLGDEKTLTDTDLSSAFQRWLGGVLDGELSASCFTKVDGRGRARVLAAMDIGTSPSLNMRRANANDEALLLEWANDPDTRRNGFSPSVISAETHNNWFRRRLEDVNCNFYICETSSGVPFGQVRFERLLDEWEVHFSLAPTFRGLKLAQPLLAEGLHTLGLKYPNSRVIGQVKETNYPSRRVFESLGFDAKLDSSREVVVYSRSGDTPLDH